MTLTAYEKETIFNYNMEEATASIYTHDKTLIKRLLASCEKYPDKFQLEKKQGVAYSFIIPKKYISVRTPRAKRKYTDEEKIKIRERLQKGKAL